MRSRTLRLALGVALAGTTAAAQSANPQLQREYDALKSKIAAAALTQDLKDSLTAQMRVALSPSIGLQASLAELGTVEKLMNDNVVALGELEATIKVINADNVLPAGLKAKFLAAANGNRKLLPRRTVEVRTAASSIKTDVGRFNTLVPKVTSYGRTFAAGNAPSALKQHVATQVATLLGDMAPGSSVTSDEALDHLKVSIKPAVDLLETIDELKAKTSKEAPRDFPQLRVNSLRELDALRANVGNPASSTTKPLVDQFQSAYQERLSWANTGAEIMKLTEAHGIADANAGKKGVLRVRLGTLMITMLDYHSGKVDPLGLQDMLNEARRFGK